MLLLEPVVAKPLPAADPGKTRREDRPLVGWSRDEHRSQKLQDNALAAAAGMSIEADAFNVLILNYTMKCSLASDFCCYGCTPKRTELMSLLLISSIRRHHAECLPRAVSAAANPCCFYLRANRLPRACIPTA